MDALAEFVGNKPAVEKARLLADYARMKGTLDHIGMFGHPGDGKTTLAILVAKYVGRKYFYLNGVAVNSAEIFRHLLIKMDLEGGGIVFIDEAHALPKSVQDTMLSLLEKPAKLITNVGGQLLEEPLPSRVSFILATSDPWQLKNAILSRLEYIYLMPYPRQDRMEIARRHFARMKVSLPAPVANEIARRSQTARDVIRTSNLLSKFCLVRNLPLTVETSRDALVLTGRDANGLTAQHLSVLRYLDSVGRAGLETIEAATSVNGRDIKDVVEPWLLKQNLIIKHVKGRIITQKGRSAIAGQRVEIW